MTWNATISSNLMGYHYGQIHGNGTIKAIVKLESNRVQARHGFLNKIDLDGNKTNKPKTTVSKEVLMQIKPIQITTAQTRMKQKIQVQQRMKQQPKEQESVAQGQIMMVEMPDGQIQKVMVVPQNMEQNVNVQHDGKGQSLFK